MRARPLFSVLGSANRTSSVKDEKSLLSRPVSFKRFHRSKDTSLVETFQIPTACFLSVEGRVLLTPHLTHTKCSLLQIVACLLVQKMEQGKLENKNAHFI